MHIPMCLSNAYGVSRERLQNKTMPASPSLDHVCVCVERLLSRLILFHLLQFRKLKVGFPHRISQNGVQPATTSRQNKTERQNKHYN